MTPLAPPLPTITATLDDNFPLASKKNPGDTINYTAVITNTMGTDASGVAYTDTLDSNTTLSGVVRVSPVTVNDTYACTGNISISVPVGNGVLTNDYLGQNPAGTITASDATSTQGGTVTVNADGSFTYNPPANFTGADTFTYTLSNVTGSSVGTVTINVSDRILFVASGGVGNCKPATPCSLTFADGLAAPSSGKDLVFVESGTYGSAAITLNAAQTIAGQAISIGTALSDAGITLAPFSQSLAFPASTTPVLNNGATIVTLGGNNLVEDLSINPTVGNGILGNNITTGATIRDLTITGTNAANGINFTGTSTGSTFNLSNIGVTTAGGMALSDVGPGAATTGGTVNATQNNTTTVNTLTSTTGTALNLVNSTIGASGVTFRSISSNGASSGIVVNNTGTTGGLTITGNGGTCTTSANCTGGAIQNSTTSGVLLTSTQSPSLTRLNTTDSAGGATDDGIKMANIPGTVTIDTCAIINSPHNGITVDNNNTNMAGFNLTNTTVSCAAGQPCQPSGSIGNDGLSMSIRGTSVLTTGLISASTFSGVRGVGVQIATADTGRIGSNSGGSITNSITVQSNTFTGNKQGIDINTSQVSNLTFQVLSNTINGLVTAPGATSAQASAVAINAFTSAGADTGPTSHTFVGKIDSNIIGTQGTKDSGSGFGSGIRAVVQGSATQGVVKINNNTIRETANADIITAIGQNGAASSPSATARFQITGNTMPTPSGSNLSLCGPANTACASNGIFGLADEGSPVCNIITGNNVYDVTTMNGTADIYLAQRVGPPAGASLQVEGVGTNSVYIQANNTLAGASKYIDEGNNTTQVAPGACGTFPSFAQPDDGGIAEQTQLPNTTTGAASASATTFAWVRNVLHPVAAFASNLNFLRSSDTPVTPTGRASAPSASEAKVTNATGITPQKKDVTPLSGETISFNLPVVLNVGKSVTIKYDATINVPPGATFVQTQGNVTFTGGPGGGINTTDPETGTQVPTKTNINTVITWIGVTSPDWNTASNWDFNYVPVSFSDVKVPNAAQPNHPTLSTSSPTINSLNLGNTRTLTISGQTLTISGNSGSDLTLDGTISGGGLNFGAGTHAINNAGLTGSITPTNQTTVLNGANVTLNNNLQMDSLTINSGGTLNITNRTLSLTGSLNNGGTLTLTGSTVIFDGTGAQTLTNTTAFNNLTINSTGGSVTLGSNITVNGTLTLTSDLTTTNSFTLTMPTTTGIIMGGADVVGNITRTNSPSPLPAATNITFGNPNTVLNFAAGAGTRPTSINFKLTKTVPTDAATGGTNTGFPAAVARTYVITPTGGSGFSATMQLHYLVGDLNGNSEANPGPGPTVSLRLYKYVINSPGTGWQQQDLNNNFANTTVDTSSPGNHFVKLVGVTGFSPWTIGGVSPTAATSTVSGRILDDNGNPVEGAVILLSGTQNRKTITDSQGNYNFFEVETNGFYTVTPSRVNYNFTPSTRGFSALGAHTEASFGATYNGGHQNPIDTTEYFVRQQYVDFLNREPEEKGFNDWTDTINNCAPNDTSCDRLHVSEMFFRSAEFQQRGYYIYRFYSAAFGRKPDYAEFTPDFARVSGFLTDEQLEAAKTAFASDFTSRPAFANQYGSLGNAQYVDALSQTAGVTLSNRQALVDSLNAGTLTRAQALRQITESGEVDAKYYNQAFVVMEYFGYLRRDPDILYLNWIDVLNQSGDARHMVGGFVDATEYRNRFKQ